MMGSIKRFLLACSGASPTVLMKPECAVEHAKYANIGAIILTTSVLAALTGGYGSYVSLRSLPVSIVAGLLWGVFVFTLDRYLAATAKKDLQSGNNKLERFGRALLVTLPRLVIMIFVGIIIALPFELRLFQREIDAQIAVNRLQSLEVMRSAIREEFPEINQLKAKNEQLNREIEAKQLERDRLLGLSQDELLGKTRSGSTGMGGVGPEYYKRKKAFETADKELGDLRSANGQAVAQNNERLKVLNNLLTTRQDEATKSTDASSGFLARVEALTMMVSRRRVMATIHYFLVLLFVLLASGPVLVIALARPGPYDYITQAIDQDVHDNHIGAATTLAKRRVVATDSGAPEGLKEVDLGPVSQSLVQRDPYKLVGAKFSGKYYLQEYAGGGGMGAVYRAVDLNSRTQVAVKILKPDLVVRNARNAISFQREVEAARTLDHPNIVRVLDTGVSGEVSYMVMEWLDGRTLEDLLAQEQLPMIRIVDLFTQVCSAFMTAHAQNIIHLDIKPANIFLLTDHPQSDRVKVIDFGMARVLSSETGTTVTRFLGTYQYCSPEHFGGKVTYRSDIYSLGATLYHMIAGVIPFGTSYINAKMHPDLELPPVPSILNIRPEVPKEVDMVIRRSLSKRPGDRQQSVTQLLADFRRAMR